MKNIKMIVAALLVALFALSSLTALAEGTVRTTGAVNLRKGPGLEYAIVDSAYKNATFAFNKTEKDSRGVVWYRVNNGGKAAWISSMYAEVVSEKQTVRATGSANLRKGPGLDYAKVGGMTEGQTAKYLGETRIDGRNVAWYKVNFNGTVGWISSKYAAIR